MCWWSPADCLCFWTIEYWVDSQMKYQWDSYQEQADATTHNILLIGMILMTSWFSIPHYLCRICTTSSQRSHFTVSGIYLHAVKQFRTRFDEIVNMPIHNQLAVLLDQHCKIVQPWLEWLEVLFQTRFKPVLVWVSHFIESSCNPMLCWVGIIFFKHQLRMGVGWVPYLIDLFQTSAGWVSAFLPFWWEFVHCGDNFLANFFAGSQCPFN